MSTVPFNKLFNIHACKRLIESKRSLKPNTTRVAIIGSRSYENKHKIREMIWLLKTKIKDLEIVSGGAYNGADKYAKKYALELGVDFVEFNPAHTVKNLYSMMPDEYYGQPYHVSQLFHRNELIAQYCDNMVAFRSSGTSSGTDHAIRMAQKYNKPVVIVSEND